MDSPEWGGEQGGEGCQGSAGSRDQSGVSLPCETSVIPGAGGREQAARRSHAHAAVIMDGQLDVELAGGGGGGGGVS